jgi:hypothetical protein
VPGVPIMYIAAHKYTIERMAEAYGAPRWEHKLNSLDASSSFFMID